MSWISKWVGRRSRPDKQYNPQPIYLSRAAPPDDEKLKELLKEWQTQPMLFMPATPVYDWDAIESDYMKANMEMAIKRGSGFLAYETVEWFKLRITNQCGKI